jgi:hypothetical protein
MSSASAVCFKMDASYHHTNISFGVFLCTDTNFADCPDIRFTETNFVTIDMNPAATAFDLQLERRGHRSGVLIIIRILYEFEEKMCRL